ncbi:PAS domain-containing protein [Clostridium botulinum]|nr:PAS domain-containing protein [Clostridium botulinum]
MSGAIKTINNNAIKLLGFNENDIKSMKMWDLIPDWSMVLDEIYDKGSFVDEDVYVHCLKNKLQLNLSAYPIYDSSMRIIEVTCLLSDIQKTRKLAGKILSGQAIYTFDKIIGKSKNFLA